MTEQEAQALAFKRNKGLSKFQYAEKIWVATCSTAVSGWGVHLVDRFAYALEWNRTARLAPTPAASKQEG